jgi:adenine-specific DNA-methyltransferase
MDKLKMQTANKADENFKKLAAMFPNAVTETIDENGEVVRAIDKDVLMQEINTKVVDGNEERYQFTWPDKKKSVLLANAPINKTLRPCREESVDFDNTENLYIEGDNLEVLKLLQETYLGKIKMIYIDPPYNTGNDFVYNDEFGMRNEEWDEVSGNYDEDGNQIVGKLEKNTEANGRFHTDWLNMIYPRLKLARDLLTEDGVIFISIDDNEDDNLRKVCDEIFGECNFLAQITIITGANQSGDGVLIQKNVEYCFVYVKSILDAKINRVDKTDEIYRNLNDAPTAFETRLDMGYTIYYNEHTGEMIPRYDYNKNLIYTNDEKLVYSDDVDLIRKGFVPIRPGKRNGKLHRWRWSLDTFLERKSDIKIFKNGDKYTPKFLQSGFNAPKNIWNYTVGTIELKKIFDASVFDYSKNVNLLKYISSIGSDKDAIIVDFFSGSATTAHAVMQLNAEDGGHRKFIMVQIPEKCDEKSEAYKAGYKNICEIGKERIRRAGAKIKEDLKSKTVTRNGKIAVRRPKDENSIYEEGFDPDIIDNPIIVKTEDTWRTPRDIEEYDKLTQNLDTGFRVLKCDTSNMKNVYYTPSEFGSESLDDLISNIKEDRTPEDLLFQVMLDLGVLLSSKIEETTIAGKKVFNVEDNYLIACFDDNVTEEVITAIAKQKPYYFVMRDSSMANDSVATNFDQIFATYSPDTVRKVL